MNLEELKAKYQALQQRVEDEFPNSEPPVELQDELQQAIRDYQTAKAEAEKEANKQKMKVEVDIMDKKQFNASLKKALLGVQDEMFAKFSNAAQGQNGATGADGGYLIPEELLPLAELNGVGEDLRSLCTVINVSTRSGKVPTVDYGAQTVGLVAFDENNDIAEAKASFGSKSYTLASKGAIIPVSRELLMDASADVLSVITKVFNRKYIQEVNTAITTLVATDASAAGTELTAEAALDAIKTAVITLPKANAAATIVMDQATFAKLAVAKDGTDNYLLARDAFGAAVKQIEGRPIVVVETGEIAANTVLVGDFSAIYHIAHPSLEIASDASAGFTRNSVLVRAVVRYTNIDVYAAAFKKLTLA